MRPYLSVIIPAYNEEASIGKCLSSLAAQKISVPFEIIVVNNNSTDATAEIAHQHRAIVVTEKRRGVCWARQAGLAASKGQVIVSSDADCYYPPDWLANTARIFQSQPDVNLFIGNYRFINSPWWANHCLVAYEWLSLQLYYAFSWTIYVSAANLAFRSSAFDGYNTVLTQGGDELGVLTELKKNGRVLYRFTNPVSTSGRRLHQGFLKTFFNDFLWSYIANYVRSVRTGINHGGSYRAIRETEFEPASRVNALQYALPLLGLLIIAGLFARFITAILGNITHPFVFFTGYILLSIGLLAYASCSPHSQLGGPQPYKVRTKRKVIALTFDDGPNGQFSLDIANYIASYGGRASFFQVGHNVLREPQVTKALFEQGHLIGNHSYQHRFSDYFKRGWCANLIATSDAIEKACGHAPKYVRLPWLFRTPWLIKSVYSLGLQPAAGSFISLREFQQPNGIKMANHFVSKVQPGDILIMHDGYNARGGDRRETVRAVAELCRQLHAQGYSFVRLDELL